MYCDASLQYASLKQVPALAKAAEALGFDAVWTTETTHDPFLAGPLLSEHTERLRFGTGIAVSFARSPATLAYTAWDLAAASGGRFILGLGTQVKAHIERRFGMPWPESPAQKLREQIEVMRAFWDTWQNNAPLNQRGEYYKVTLMTPFFNPGPIKHPHIPIFLAGVNTGLARLTGELADGFHVHPFHTPRYLSEILRPAIAAGAEKAQRQASDVQVNVVAFIATDEFERQFARQQISFYASTPSYRAVMDLHGWSDKAEELSAMASKGKWGDMPAMVTDEMLETFAVVCSLKELPGKVVERYRGLAERIGLYMPYFPGERDPIWRELIEAAHAA